MKFAHSLLAPAFADQLLPRTDWFSGINILVNSQTSGLRDRDPPSLELSSAGNCTVMPDVTRKPEMTSLLVGAR